MAVSIHSINYRFFLKFLYANLEKLDDLMALAAEFAGAATMQARWEAIKKIGDLFASAKEPEDDAIAAFQTETDEALEAKVLAAMQASGNGYSAQAWDGSRLRRIWDTIQPFLPILIGLLQAK